MFCPECRTEYVEGVQRCADCDVPLIPDLQPLPEEEFKNFVKLYSPADAIDLVMVRSFLDGAGIDYFVRNDNFGSLYTGIQIGLFNCQEIMVNEDELKKAEDLLSDYLKNSHEDADEDE